MKGALRCLRQHGAEDADIEIVRAPGAYEMPIAVEKIAATRRFDGIIALGAVIRGGTPHFDYVAAECVKGVTAAAREHGVPIGFGVLTSTRSSRRSSGPAPRLATRARKQPSP